MCVRACSPLRCVAYRGLLRLWYTFILKKVSSSSVRLPLHTRSQAVMRHIACNHLRWWAVWPLGCLQAQRAALPALPRPLQAEEEQRERVRRALQEVDAELVGDGEEDPYWVPFDDCPGAGEHCAACWGCPQEIMKLR